MEDVRAWVVAKDDEQGPRQARRGRGALVAGLIAAAAVSAVLAAVVLGDGAAAPGPPAPVSTANYQVLRGSQLAFACSAPCDELRLRLRFKDPATRVWATLAGRTAALADAIGSGRSFAAVLPDTGVRANSLVEVALLVERADGTRQNTAFRTWLEPRD